MPSMRYLARQERRGSFIVVFFFSLVAGVRFLSHRTGKPWRAEIWDPTVGRMTHVGCYEKEEEAAHAYEEAVKARAANQSAAAAAGGGGKEAKGVHKEPKAKKKPGNGGKQ